MIAVLIRCVNAIFSTAIADASEWVYFKDLARDLYNYVIIMDLKMNVLIRLLSFFFLHQLLITSCCQLGLLNYSFGVCLLLPLLIQAGFSQLTLIIIVCSSLLGLSSHFSFFFHLANFVMNKI